MSSLKSIRADHTTIHYGTAKTPFGNCFIATSTNGVCYLAFCNSVKIALTDLNRLSPDATLMRNDMQASILAATIFDPSHTTTPLDFSGTHFQTTIWRTLMTIPYGNTISYGELASKAGYPNAHRAVGTAVGNNPIAYLIPCHRVIRTDGALGNYRWGVGCKKVILQREQNLQ